MKTCSIFSDVLFHNFFEMAIKQCFEKNHIKIGRKGIWLQIRKVKLKNNSIIIYLPKNTGFVDKIEIPFPTKTTSSLNYYRFIKGKRKGEYQSEEIFFKHPLLL